MEDGELGAENMEALTELGDELTLGDIDGGRRGKGGERGWGGGARGWDGSWVSLRGVFPLRVGAQGGRTGLVPLRGVGFPRGTGRERGIPLSRVGECGGCGARPAGQRSPGERPRVSPRVAWAAHGQPRLGSASERL